MCGVKTFKKTPFNTAVKKKKGKESHGRVESVFLEVLDGRTSLYAHLTRLTGSQFQTLLRRHVLEKKDLVSPR